MADTWFDRRTYRWDQWDPAALLRAKRDAGVRVTVVIPALDEAATVGDVAGRIHDAFVGDAGLVDELLVIDSGSTDDTARLAAQAGATVHHLADIRPDLGSHRGKGEAIWKAQFVATGDVLVFVDADLTEWGTHFVTGLLGPLVTDPSVTLVKGFYERPYREGALDDPDGGGRATELVARPALALLRPELTHVVQPLAGEWAVRRTALASLSVPVGYGVDLAALVDVSDAEGIGAIAQVDLGRRAHSHQPLRALGAMSVQLLAAMMSRAGRAPDADEATLRQFRSFEGAFVAMHQDVDLTERPPFAEVAR
ncbi:glucosyl-3-phosphoglycerate synthase [Aeromicrobium sp. Marseille-Q0843]|uniref:Glucosyl-3-phosphoglycerate synthase n=1 Tax=Aeromicrobium phoceense TaxID=2754045 RepID=A0A838XBL3_9ACTN|nr:glucosyl-3-phosphoglycerate synthase [Aeromicrobium phoceense]